MSGVWHPQYSAFEVYGSRVENWNDVNPTVSVILRVAASDLDLFVCDLVHYKYEWPENATAPFYLYVSNVEVLPVASCYTAEGTYDERIGSTNPRDVRVTYSPLTQFLRTIDTSAHTGTSTAYGFQTQEVWVEYNRIPSTEFLTIDFNDFCWPDETPLLPDEAPGRIMRYIKFVVKYRNIYLTEDLEDILYNYSGTVNNSSLTLASGNISFDTHQVLFMIENVNYTLNAVIDVSAPTPVNLVDLTCSFKCMKEGTWNKFWRPYRKTGNATSNAGWYSIHFKRKPGDNYFPVFEPYLDTNYWYCLWV